MRALAVAMVVLPIAGMLFHAFIYAKAPAWGNDYIRGPALKAVAIVSFINLFGNWFHYRHTRMSLDVLSRVLTYLLILSMVLMLPGVGRTWGF
jgi:integral membrane sensor domain MASE1